MIDRLPALQRGDEVFTGADWYPVIGYSLCVKPNAPTTGTVFTDKPHGSFRSLGYEIDYANIERVRRKGVVL